MHSNKIICKFVALKQNIKINQQMKKIKEILKAMPREKEMEAREKIGVAMWPKATPLQRCINLQNIMSGRTTRVTPDGIKIIASILGVTPNDILEWDGENVARETVKTA